MTARARRFWRRKSRLLTASSALILAAVLGASLYSTFSTGTITAGAGVLNGEESFSGPGGPNVYFWINYSGPGVGMAAYVLTYNVSSGEVLTVRGGVVVRRGAPFTYYLVDSPPPGEIGYVNVAVYSGGTPGPSDLAFNGTVWV
ncbi:MAG: hypothetical protein JRN08_06930 [Nitrososphaerota archaeon]|nr:hypothetical protein [Nitrososphaerota archaeon]